VVHEAIRCAIEKHGKRKGAVKPERASPVPAANEATERAEGSRRARIPAALRRAVWERDGGRCTWTSPDGRRCETTWQLEVDHLDAIALGGQTTLERLALRCKPHNILHAEQDFGREFMDLFRRARP
jgi:5-methylcytosine-specific restriction endonuclease McrA